MAGKVTQMKILCGKVLYYGAMAKKSLSWITTPLFLEVVKIRMGKGGPSDVLLSTQNDFKSQHQHLELD